MSRPAYLVTIDDFERAYGSRAFAERVFRSDDPLLTSTTGAYATHYGAKVWAQLNFETNLFGILPKVPWGPEDGWRVITAAPSTKATGVAENGAIPDTVKPTFAHVTDKPKSVVTNFNSSEIEILSAKRGQAVRWEDLREVMGEFHRQGINDMLTKNNDDAKGSNDIYGLDHIVSSYSEVHNISAIEANNVDVYGIDRDAAASWADATVIHNSGTPIPLSLSKINQLIRSVSKASGVFSTKDLVFVTGYDTVQRWGELLQPMQRFVDAKFTLGKNLTGIERWGGREGGFWLHTYNGIPIVPNQFVEDNLAPNNGLSPIFLLNLNHLKLWVDVPTVYREVGVSYGNELLYGKLGEEGMYKTILDTVCTGFYAQGKYRDISDE